MPILSEQHEPKDPSGPPLTPIIPALTNLLPVSPIIPALTQNRGWGSILHLVTYLEYVGAPTFWGTMYRAPLEERSPRNQCGMGEVECGPERFMRNIRGTMARQRTPRIQYTSMNASMAAWRWSPP
jgi:hypothetical protein